MTLTHLMIITAVVTILVIIFNIALSIASRKPKDENAENIGVTAKILRSIFRNETPLTILITQSVTCLLLGILLISTGMIMGKYKEHGALYEDEINMPINAIVAHFEFPDESDALKTALESGANLEDLDVVIVRFGCKDCSNNYDEIMRLHNENNAYIVFSRSEIGKQIVETYNITAVPAYVHENVVTYYN